MGYFTSAFVFQKEPDWSLLDGVAQSIAILAVRHQSSQLGLLTIWHCGADEPDYPFNTQFEAAPQALSAEIKDIDTEVADQIGQLIAASMVMSNDFGCCAETVIRPALESGWLLHRALAIPMFFFAGNDEGSDVAFFLDDGKLKRFKMIGENGSAELANGRIEVSPLIVVVEDEEEFEPDLTTMADYPDVVVHPIKRIAEEDIGATQMFSTSLELWLPTWPEPALSLGLGTWDPLPNYPQDYDSVFIRR